MTVAAGSWTIFLPDEEATLRFAAHMANCLPKGRQFVLYLQGDLGTGKTTLSRGMLRARGEQGAVRSPTYGLMAEYETPHGSALHLDLYRMRSAEELAALGLADYLADARLWLIEWPEKAAGARMPPADARVLITVEASGRRFEILSGSETGRLWLGCLSLYSV